jgi:dienelactone hydrolase
MRHAFLLCALLLALLARAGDTPVNWKEEMRLPVPTAGQAPPRVWLACGEFPLPTAYVGDLLQPQPRVGFDNDYLQRHGGEAGIRPVAGMAHLRPNGTSVAWQECQTKMDALGYDLPFPRAPQHEVVWYAYTLVARAAAGPAALAVRGNQPMKVWVNGALVDTHYLARPEGFEDVISVPFQAGDNAVLVKIVQRKGPSSVGLRVLEPAEAELQELAAPRLAPSLIDEPGRLTVRTDDRCRDFVTADPPVMVDVIAPGGAVVATAVVTRGESAAFPTAGWAEGPYEVRCRIAGPRPERAVTAYRAWYLGDAVAAAKALAPPEPGDVSPAALVRGLLIEMAAARADGKLDTISPLQLPDLYPILMEAAELNGGGVRPNGCVRLAWRDEVDDSPQFCRVYLPYTYDPAKTYPVIVSLHGRADDFPPYAKWGGSDVRHDGIADRYDVITVYPHGRGNAWYRGMGERDVLRALAAVQARFPVDPARVYLTGASMGGTGTWYVGTRHPQTFAALAPFFGGYDYRFQLPDKALNALSAKERFRRERFSYIAQAEGLLTTPVLAAHGDADPLVPVDYSRYTVRLLQRWGYDVRYQEFPGIGHGGINTTPAIEWLLTQRLERNPPRVRVRAVELRTAAAHWLRIEARKDPYAPMLAFAEVVADNTIRLETDNVQALTLSPEAPLVDWTRPVTVVWNGIAQRAAGEGSLALCAPGYTPAPLHKRPALEGPTLDIWNTPVALVVGTASPDPLTRALCARAAARLQAWWHERHHVPLRLYTDSEVPDAVLADCSLLLFGGPAENLVTRRLEDKLPLKTTPYTVTIDGKTFRARDAAVQVAYPSPLNRDRYVVVRAATSPRGFFFTDYLLNDTDFSLVDARNADPAKLGDFFDVVTGRNSGPVLAAGYFNNAWKLVNAHIERGGAGRRFDWTVPTVGDPDTVTDMSLDLADAVEAAAEGAFLDAVRKSVRLGRTRAAGFSLPGRYWLPKAPCSMTFTLGGTWDTLRGTVGLEANRPTPEQVTNTDVVFVVKGDGVELFRSNRFDLATPPAAFEVDVRGVRKLQLVVLNTTTGASAIRAIDWAGLRLTRDPRLRISRL